MDKLIKFAEADNLTDQLNDTELAKLSEDVLRRASEDKKSMQDWESCVEEGLKLCKPEFKPRDEPWPGASNYKSMILPEAANEFGNRCKIELMRDRDLVKTEIIGQRTIKNLIEQINTDNSIEKEQLEKMMGMVQQLQESGGQVDPQMQEQLTAKQQEIVKNEDKIKALRASIKDKNQRCDRVSEAMNWAVNNKMPTWRQDHIDMLYRLPLHGTSFKKTVYDDLDGCYKSHVIMYPDFIVNQATVNLDSARSFTHIIAVSQATAQQRVKDGTWRDIPLFDVEYEADAGTDEAEGAETTDKNPERFYEQYCWIDLDDDGIQEPYIVTLHVASGHVVRIVARYDVDTIIVSSTDELYDFGALPIPRAQRSRAAIILADAKEMGVEPVIPEGNDLSGFKVVAVKPQPILTKYGFMKSIDNTFLDVGLFHWIGPKTMGINKATNDLLNASTLANNPFGFTAKGFRKKQGPITMRPGELKATEIDAQSLQSSIWMNQFREPSQTLLALRDGLENESRGFSANVDATVQSNTAPTTALAMVQESMMKHSAHVSLIIDSMSDEFKILFSLIRNYFSKEDYRELTGDEEANIYEDFAVDGLAIICGANPEMSSRMQRMILAQAEMEQVPVITQAGGNPLPIIKNYLYRIGTDNVDEIFPNEAEMSPEEKAQMQAMQQQQQMSVQMQQQQLELTQLQTELLKRDQDRKDFEAQSEAKERDAKIAQMIADTMNDKFESFSRSILNLEKAESEEVKNQISQYTAASNEITKAEQAAQVVVE